MSPKPDAGYKIRPECIPSELKYVVTEGFDEDVITEDLRQQFAGRIWLQPDGFNMKRMWNKCYAMAMCDSRLRVGVQLHKLMEAR